MESPKKVKPKMAIGFDLGTTSVGWSVIAIDDQSDERKLTILDMGVRMFDDPAEGKSNAQERRIARGRRRRIWRQRIRKYELFKLLQEYKIVKDETEFHEFITSSIYDEETDAYFLPVEIKIKGLESGLTKQQLTLILHNYIKHRGIINTIDPSEEKKKKEAELTKKAKELYYDDSNKDDYPCKNQYEWYKSSGNVIGNLGNYIITNEDYKKEICDILSNQKHLNIDQNFVKEFLKIFERHRHYSEGPGSKKMLTPYGRTKYDENGNLIWIDDKSKMWDKLVGKCTYYPDEKRNYKKSPVTEVFNLLNDLAKMVFIDETAEGGRRRLNLLEKQSILRSEKFTLKSILKSVGKTEKHVISGLRLNNNVETVEEMKSTKALLKWLKENNLWSNLDLNKLETLELLHQIFTFGVRFQNKKERLEEFVKLKNSSASEEYKLLASALANASCGEVLENLVELEIWTSSTSALSKRAQMEFITFAITNENSNGIEQMAYFKNNRKIQNKNNQFDKCDRFFPRNIFQNEAMPATVKRTFNQAVKVLNAILQNKKFHDYQLSHIIVELARELNSEKEKNRIKNELEENKKYLSEKMRFHGINDDQLKGANRLKFLLWEQQNKQDIYDGEEINLNDLLSNPNKYHIDHIIPISISFTNSMQNKVLTKATRNLSKGNKTPYQWLSSRGEYADYKTRCQKLLDNLNDKEDKKRKLKLERKIKKYLLYEGDPFSELTGFVGRQLNDTRYISSEFTNKINLFFTTSKYWKQQPKIIINSINGSLTSFARSNIFIEETEEKRKLFKNRDIYSHHAIDATIIAFLGLNNNIERLLKFFDKGIVKRQINGEDQYVYSDCKSNYKIIAQKRDFLEELSEKSKYFRNQMIAFVDPNISSKFVRFSRMIISKSNIPLSNDTIYSLRKFVDHNGTEHVHKIDFINILEKNNKKLANYFGDIAKNKNDLLCYQYDKNLYNAINKIYLEYHNNDEENSFKKYLESESIKEFFNNQKIKPQQVNKVPIISNSGEINWVLKLKVKSKEIKKMDEILKLKKHNENAFYDSLKFTGIRIYKKNNGKYQTVFLSVLNLEWNYKKKSLVVNEDKIKKTLKDYDISNFKFLEIKNGTMLIKNKKLFYCTGGGNRNQNKLEIKYLAMSNKAALLYDKDSIKNQNDKDNTNDKDNRLIISINSISRDYKICKVDYLGHIYDIQSFDEYFKN